MKVMLKNVRLAFPSLWRKRPSPDGDEGKFQAVLLIDPKTQAEQVKAIELAMADAANEKLKGKLPPTDKRCLRDGDDKADYDGFEGMVYLSTNSATRPTVIDTNRSPLTEEDGRPYAGCYVNASVEIWGQNNAYGKRVNAQLRGVQFVRDGEAFGGAVAASADEFEELEPTTEGNPFEESLA